MHTHLVPCGCSGDDAIEILRVSLSFGETLPASLRAAVVVGEFRGSSVVGTDDHFGLHGHLMNRAITKIDHLFWMTQRKVSIVSGVSGIGSRSGIPGAQSRSNCCER